MPSQPIQSQDTYADIQFPLGGLDLTLGFGGQRQGTTRVGVNVRANEPLAQSARGGARPGLVKYIDGTVGGVHLVQHLNYVVDPQAQALPWYDPPYPDPNSLTGPGIAGGPNPFVVGDGPIPGTHTDPSGNVIRYGGTGIRYRKKRKPLPAPRFAFVKGALSSAGTATFGSNVTAGHLLLARYVTVSTTFGATVAFSDTQSNSWVQAGSYERVTDSADPTKQLSISMWYTIAGTTGGCAVSAVESSGGHLTFPALEFSCVGFTIAPDSNGSNSEASPASTDVSTGFVAASPLDLLVGTAYAGVNAVSLNADDVFGNVYWFLGVAGGLTMTGSQGSPQLSYVAVGASFLGS